MRIFFLLFSLFTVNFSLAQTDVQRIYRHSFTARYEGLAGGAQIREVAFSADSARVGYVRAGDLWVKHLLTGVETRITRDGAPGRVINGATDWVYEEEYGFTKAWAFSPDGGEVAWLRMDESNVREYTLMRHDGPYPTTYTYKYPLAGEANSSVTIHVHDLATGETRLIDPEAEYVPRLDYTPAGGLFYYRVNRLQNRFEVVLDGRTIYSETSPAYVERPDAETIVFQDDGEFFVARNETRTGWWTSDLWHISKGFVRELSRDERAPDLHEWNAKKWDNREFFALDPAAGADSLYGWMLKPAGFDPAKKYPVLMTQYSGPGSVSVFVEQLPKGDREIYDPLLEAGYIVVCVDPRGTGGRGEAFKKQTYRQLGKLETEDQIRAARWLASLAFVDGERIGIYGWSYGGFVALNSILHGADVFAAAVAVAPVTSWRLYDTIYTETYNGLPRENPRGYDDNSPLTHADLLAGRLLLIHGTADDNVHPDNTLAMARALVAEGRQFDMMLYPDANHSMNPNAAHHVREKIVNWIKDNL